jgi:hypothetical protein
VSTKRSREPERDHGSLGLRPAITKPHIVNVLTVTTTKPNPTTVVAHAAAGGKSGVLIADGKRTAGDDALCI